MNRNIASPSSRQRTWLLAVFLLCMLGGAVYAFFAWQGAEQTHTVVHVDIPVEDPVRRVDDQNTDGQSLVVHGQSTLVIGKTTDAAASGNPLAKIYTADRANDAVQKVESKFGMDSQQTRWLKYRVAGACADVNSRYTNAILAQAQPDPSREWAVASLLRYCEGWDASANPSGKFFKPAESVSSVLRRDGKDAAINYANENLREQVSGLELFEAAQFLNEQGLIPTPEQLGLPQGEFGPQDQVEALFSSAVLLECHLANACGSNSIVTLNYCLTNGCRPNSDYLSALSQNVSPSEFQLITAYAQWMLARRQRTGE